MSTPLPMPTQAPLPENLVSQLDAYVRAFGHGVPSDVVRAYAGRPGPLILEIKQAVALQRPVPAWLTRSKSPATTPREEWYPRMPD